MTLVLALVAGAIAIALSAAFYRQSRSHHIMPHLYLVGSVNAIVLLNISVLYFYQNLSSQASPAMVSAVDNAYLMLVPGAQVLAVCSLWHLGQALLLAK